MTDQQIRVFDDVLADPLAYRAGALAQPYGSVTQDGETMHGLAACTYAEIPLRLSMQLGIDVHLTFFRRSPEGQEEPTFIHSDASMGEVTAILYLNPEPPHGDGTTFWERLSTGARDGEWDEATARAARDRALWTPWKHVDARFNRLLVFQSDLYHSRGLIANHGTEQDPRLIQVAFGRYRV